MTSVHQSFTVEHRHRSSSASSSPLLPRSATPAGSGPAPKPLSNGFSVSPSAPALPAASSSGPTSSTSPASSTLSAPSSPSSAAATSHSSASSTTPFSSSCPSSGLNSLNLFKFLPFSLPPLFTLLFRATDFGLPLVCPVLVSPLWSLVRLFFSVVMFCAMWVCFCFIF
ncbi:hypothetical protein ACSBR2_026436 [Camellia fascicularis]